MGGERKGMEVLKEEKRKVEIKIDSRVEKKEVGVEELLEVIKMENEINEVRKNGKLSREERIGIKNL